jgi:hypothetical protein
VAAGGGTGPQEGVERRGGKRSPPWQPRSMSSPPPGEESASAGPAPATERSGSRAVRPTEDDGRKEGRRYSRCRIRAASARRQACWRIGGSQARGRRRGGGFGGSGRLSSLARRAVGGIGVSVLFPSLRFARARTHLEGRLEKGRERNGREGKLVHVSRT